MVPRLSAGFGRADFHDCGTPDIRSTAVLAASRWSTIGVPAATGTQRLECGILGFELVSLLPGEEKTVLLTVTVEHLSTVGDVLEPGNHMLEVAGQAQRVNIMHAGM